MECVRSRNKQAKGKFISERLSKGDGFAFKKIKDLEADGGQDICISEFDEKQLPDKFLNQYIKASKKPKLKSPTVKPEDFDGVCRPLVMSELENALRKV